MNFAVIIAVAVAAYFLVNGGEGEAMSDSFYKWDSLFKKYAAVSGVDWKMLKAIAMNESRLGDEPSVARGLASRFDIEASKSSDGKSWGLMQLTVPTASDFSPDASPAQLNDPEFSVRVAAQFVAWLQRQFPTVDPRFEEYVVKSYNQGVGNMRKEISGKSDGFAQDYWERYLRNYSQIEE